MIRGTEANPDFSPPSPTSCCGMGGGGCSLCGSKMRFKSLENSGSARIDGHAHMLRWAVHCTYFCTENHGIIFSFSHVDVYILCAFWASYVVSQAGTRCPLICGIPVLAGVLRQNRRINVPRSPTRGTLLSVSNGRSVCSQRVDQARRHIKLWWRAVHPAWSLVPATFSDPRAARFCPQPAERASVLQDGNLCLICQHISSD